MKNAPPWSNSFNCFLILLWKKKINLVTRYTCNAMQGRRSFRALKGLVRLQGVVRGQNVKRQTVNAMKHMQLLVRVQSQIQSRRIQMLENQARYQAEFKNDKEAASILGKLTVSLSNLSMQFFWEHGKMDKCALLVLIKKKFNC